MISLCVCKTSAKCFLLQHKIISHVTDWLCSRASQTFFLGGGGHNSHHVFRYWCDTSAFSSCLSQIYTTLWPLARTPGGTCVCVSLSLSLWGFIQLGGDGHLHHPDMLQHLPSIWSVWSGTALAHRHSNHKLFGCEMMTDNDKEAGTPRDCETVKMWTQEVLQSECTRSVIYVNK